VGYLLVFACFFLIENTGNAQTTIASEPFENSLNLFTPSGAGYTYYSGNSGTGDRPASSPLFTQGSFGWGVKNNTGTLTSSAINTASYSSISLSFRLASFSIGGAGNGADPSDIVTVEVSPNGGTNYYSTVRVLGRGNACWSFSGGTGIASTAYDGNAASVDFQPTAGGLITTEGYSTVSISNLPAVSDLRVRITFLNNATDEVWLMDDFKVQGTLLLPCASPLNAGTATITSASGCASTNFTLNATGVSIGTGISYQWQSSPTGLAGTWTNISGANATSLATSASSTTFYQLLTTCSNDNSTNTTITVSYTVTGSPCTCVSYSVFSATSALDADITNVLIGSMNNTSLCAAAVGTGGIASRYSNYTGSVSGPTVQLGSTVSFSLTSNVCTNSAYDNGFQLYIDWNQNGNFLDAGEQVYSASASVSGTHSETGSFVVPLTATLGTTRMRVVNVEISFPTTTNYAQSNYSWGETEDYCITLTAASACSGIPSPGNTVASLASVTSGSSTALSLQNVTSGSGVTYQWYSSTTSASGPWTAIGSATSATYTATPAASSTWYYCDVTCSGSTGSSAPVQVTATYCTSTNTGTSYYINSVSTSTGVSNISNTTNANSSSGYGDFTAQVVSGYAGNTINYTYTWNTTGGVGLGVWVDWNGNVSFGDANEIIYNTNGLYNFSNTYSGTITIPAGTSPGTYRLRFKINFNSPTPTVCGTANGETEDYSFVVLVNTPCSGAPAPGNTLASVTSLSSGATTNLSLQNATSGTGVTYQWYSNTSNSTSGGTLISGATSATYTATVTSTTWYYCAVTCSGTTTFSNPVQVVVNYCTTNLYTYGCTSYDDYINSITVSNLNQTGTLCTGTTGIVNYTGITVNFNQGTTYNYTITSGALSEHVGFWIDFNDNGNFGDAGEFIGGTTTSSSNNTITGTVAIPGNATLGIHRMRVRLVSGTAQTLSTSCTPYSWGETHDYTANISASSPCSGTPSPGNTVTSSASVLSGATTNLTLQNATTGSGVTYQWYSSTASATGPWTLINGATNSTYTATITANSWFYCVVTCPGNGGTSSTPVGVTVTLTPNVDCSSAIQLCSDSQVNGASSGDGIADLTISTSGCLGYSPENQSNWFYSQVSTTGVFSFSITPANGTDDYDFAVWRFSGTPATCPPQAQPDRCSFAAVGGNTGLGNNATDASEDTGGDRWVSTLNVNAGDYILILVNNYSATYSPFTMDFTGNSGLNCNPVNLQCNISGTTNACIGSSVQLTGSGSPAVSTPWTSSSPSVATVSNTGVVSGLSAGTTTITYVNSNGCSTSILFTVSSTTINISNITTTVCSGNWFTVSPTNGTNGAVPAGTTYTWSAPSGVNFNDGEAESGASTINGTLTLSSGSSATAVYTVTPTSGTCTGNTFTVTVGLSSCAPPVPFAECNLVVYEVGNNTSLDNSAFPVSVKEITPNGANVQTIANVFLGTNLLTQNGIAESVGLLNSYNGFLSVSGYSVNTGTALNTSSPASAALINKVNTILDGNGLLQSYTSLPTNAPIPFSGNHIRSTLATGANTFYATGNGGNDGLYYYNGTTFSQLVSANARGLEIFNNQLYISTINNVFQVGTGLPISGIQTTSALLPTYSNSSIYDFSISPDGCTMYVADNGSNANYRGVSKYKLISGTWTYQYNYQTWGIGLVVNYSGTNDIVYVTTATNGSNTPNKIEKLIDNPTASSFTVITTGWPVTPANNNRFAGIDFTPNSTTVIANSITTQPVATVNLCNTQTQTLSVTHTGSATYQWYSNSVNTICGATPISGAVNATYTPPATGVDGTVYYFVKVAVNCYSIFTSTISAVTTTITTTPTATNNSPFCSGENNTLTLQTPTVSGATYSWTGPNSFASSTQNPTVTTNASSIHQGTYSVTTTVNGCTSSVGTTVVTIYASPSVIFLSPP
jgi:hypothetical protein